jgi:hypothetical protein
MSEGEFRVRVVFRGNGFGRTSACAAHFEERLAGVGFRVLRRAEERGDDA